MKRLVFGLIMILGLVAISSAQDATRYLWDSVGLSVPVPPGWAAPVALEQNGNPVLLLKPALTGADAADSISIQYKRVTGAAMQEVVTQEFAQANWMLAVTETESRAGFDGGAALAGFGTDAAQTVYARVQVNTQADGQFIVVTVSGPLTELDQINTLFAHALLMTANDVAEAPSLPYAILWDKRSTGAEGTQAFINAQALVADARTVYVADQLNGVMAFDALTGDFLWQQPVSPDAQITALTIDATGTLYAADTGICACVYRVTQAEAQIFAQGFAAGAPQSLVAAGTALYATDLSADGAARVRVFDAQGETDSLLFETPLQAQPRLLKAPDQTVYAITDTYTWLKQEGSGFSQVAAIDPLVGDTSQMIVNEDGSLTVFTPAEVYELDMSGAARPIGDGRSDAVFQPDSTPIAVSQGPDGTLYTLERTSADVRLAAQTRASTERLIPNRVINAALFSEAQQVWMLMGKAGDIFDLTAVPVNSDDTFLLAVRLIDSQGQMLATQFISATPQPPTTVTLAVDGLYFIQVERLVDTPLSYQLGYSLPRPVAPEQQALVGTLSTAIPVQRWIILAQSGQTLNARVTALSGDLDPALRLVNPRGDEVALNEDLDPTLGLDAGLTDVRLSNNGDYILEVLASSGAGQYSLTLTTNK